MDILKKFMRIYRSKFTSRIRYEHLAKLLAIDLPSNMEPIDVKKPLLLSSKTTVELTLGKNYVFFNGKEGFDIVQLLTTQWKGFSSIAQASTGSLVQRLDDMDNRLQILENMPVPSTLRRGAAVTKKEVVEMLQYLETAKFDDITSQKQLWEGFIEATGSCRTVDVLRKKFKELKLQIEGYGYKTDVQTELQRFSKSKFSWKVTGDCDDGGTGQGHY